MRRVTIIIMMFAVFSLSAQHQATSISDKAIALTAAESQRLQSDLDRIQQQRIRKTGPGFLSQRMAHYEIARLQFGNLLTPVYTPVAPDSNYVQVFKADENINIHGFGQTIDPTSMGFSVIGQSGFSKSDSYTIDTIYVGVRYRTSSPTTGLTGDTLRIQTFHGLKTNSSVWEVGIGYPANTFPNQPFRINVVTPKYQGHSSVGTPGTITAANMMEIKYALSDEDTTVNFIKIVPPSPIQVPAGHKFGIFCDFIPGYSYDPNTQKYYISGGKGDVNNLSWLYYTAQSNTDNTPYFLEPLQVGAPSDGISHILFSETRYRAWTGSDAFRNNYVAPSTNSGNIIDFWVSGNSSVGLDERKMLELDVYPNPTNGQIHINIAEGGSYQLQGVSTTGQTLYQEELRVNGHASLSRDLSHLPAGIYILQLVGEDQKSTARLIIQ